MQTDKVLACVDCRQEFTFTAGEQEFYASRGFTDPRRCPACRSSRKAARSDEGGGGGYGGGGGGYSGGGGSSSGGGYSGGSRGAREMFTVTCSSCGRDAQVPFRPTSGKPVYCTDCFASRRSAPSY